LRAIARASGRSDVGSGIDLARADNPHHAQLLDDFKDQLLIAFVRRLGGEVTVPVKEVDETGAYLLSVAIVDRVFNFALQRKM